MNEKINGEAGRNVDEKIRQVKAEKIEPGEMVVERQKVGEKKCDAGFGAMVLL